MPETAVPLIVSVGADGWFTRSLGTIFTTAVAGILAAIGGWYLRRPTEGAAMAAVMDNRIKDFNESLMTQRASDLARCDDLEKRIIADRRICDEQLDALRDQLNAATASRTAAIRAVEARLEAIQMRVFPGFNDDDGTLGGGLK